MINKWHLSCRYITDDGRVESHEPIRFAGKDVIMNLIGPWGESILRDEQPAILRSAQLDFLKVNSADNGSINYFCLCTTVSE